MDKKKFEDKRQADWIVDLRLNKRKRIISKLDTRRN